MDTLVQEPLITDLSNPSSVAVDNMNMIF